MVTGGSFDLRLEVPSRAYPDFLTVESRRKMHLKSACFAFAIVQSHSHQSLINHVKASQQFLCGKKHPRLTYILFCKTSNAG